MKAAGVVLLSCLTLQAQTRPVAAVNLRELSQSMTQLTRRLTPAVVLVLSDGFRPIGENAPIVTLQQATGSGVILSADGYIVTNRHVVAGATRVEVQLPPQQPETGRSIVRPRGRTVAARVVGVDRETDLALLKVDLKDLPHLELGDSDRVEQGQLVFALGNPRGLESSISMGIVSAVGRQLRPDDRVVYVQTDAPINPGNSGGPLLNVDGEVVGINTLIVSESSGSEGLGFALPSNIVGSVVEQLRTKGTVTRGDIGVTGQTVTQELAGGLGLTVGEGVIVADVLPKGPADNAGVRVGDIVLALNGKPMENARQFHVNLYGFPVASTVRLDLLRGKEKLNLTVVVLDRQDGPDRFGSMVNDGEHLISRLGVLGIALDPEVRQKLPGLRHEYGILVARMSLTSSAPVGLLQPGDVVYSLNGQALSTLFELRQALDGVQSGTTIVLQVEREGKLRYVEVPID